MINTSYHKSINKTLISRNYFDGLQKRSILCDDRTKHPGFAIGISKGFGKSMAIHGTFGWLSTKLSTNCNFFLLFQHALMN
jgi:hypothetical protein